jgi:triosephosphate isomerase
MSRTPIIAGNWKCNMRLESAFELANGVRERIDEIEGIEKVVCPPFVYLATVEAALSMSSIAIGGQNLHWEDDTAATGEIGPQQLRELCEYVIVGHSERRHVFGEPDNIVNRKVAAALGAGLKPILCVGETLDERDAGQMESVLVRQTRAGIAGVEVPRTFVIAYEPVWAIGTGRAATPDDAEQAIAIVRRELTGACGDNVAAAVRILYGGSVTPDNVSAIMERDGVDGALVGGASLKVDAFSEIVKRAAVVRA